MEESSCYGQMYLDRESHFKASVFVRRVIYSRRWCTREKFFSVSVLVSLQLVHAEDVCHYSADSDIELNWKFLF